jgi:hypothetical protein
MALSEPTMPTGLPPNLPTVTPPKTRILVRTEVEERRLAIEVFKRLQARKVREQAAETRDEMRSHYWHDPAAFMRECIHWPPDKTPSAYQLEIADMLVKHKRVSVRGPHSLGKTAMAAMIVLWFAITRDGLDWKVATTASAWRQLQLYLWPEIRKWARMLNWQQIGRPPFIAAELMSLNLRLTTGEAFAVASDNPALIEGVHADHLLYLFDEAKAIIAGTWEAAEGAFSGAGKDTMQEAYALAISTPGPPSGQFYDIHARRPGYEDWAVRHVTLDECIAAGRIAEEWVEQRRRQWGEDSTVFQNRVLGEFATEDPDSVIPLAWIEAANDRWRFWQRAGKIDSDALTTLGVDLGTGREGSDATVLAPRYGTAIDELRISKRLNTMEATGAVVSMLEAKGGIAIVDVIGIGAGVVDRLREQDKAVLAFNASTKTEYRDRSGELKFANLRAAAWWHLREKLDPAYGEDTALPPDDNLTGDLTAPRWSTLSNGSILIESKEAVRKRIGRSTDHGDAVVEAFADELLVQPKAEFRVTFLGAA